MFEGFSFVADLLLIEVRIIELLICPSPRPSFFCASPFTRFLPRGRSDAYGFSVCFFFCVIVLYAAVSRRLYVSVESVSRYTYIWQSAVSYNINKKASARGKGFNTKNGAEASLSCSVNIIFIQTPYISLR